MSTGKWCEPDVPHKGWACVGMDDLEDDRSTCEMCEVTEIRYVHIMTHLQYDAELRCGCICAEHMEEDYAGPRLRERKLRSRLSRRARWLQRSWLWSDLSGGVQYLNADQFHIAIWRNGSEGWTGRVTDNSNDRSVLARRVYPDADAAKLAAFDAMLALKERRQAP